jgi:hypothetical protein
MFEDQKKQAEEAIQSDKLSHITAELKKRLVSKKECEDKIKKLTKEIHKLVESGELNNLEDYIKIDADTDFATNTGLHINLTN